jgi:DNA-binding MarR family transcriptional regulator
MANPARTRQVAERVWRLMFELLMRSAPQRTGELARRGLTPNDSRALFSLAADEGRAMRSLAEEWGCDPSNATWIVDRLEKLGLAQRRTVLHDRRVKLVVLTAKGAQLRAELLREFHRPPPELAELGREDLVILGRLLEKLSPARAADPGAPAPRPSARKRRPES